MSSGRIFIISSPSGGGKSTICKRVIAAVDNLHYSISTTTREPREGEKNGIDYFFISKDKFKIMIENNEFLEWAQVHGNYYGTYKKFIKDRISNNINTLLDIDVQGAMQVMEKMPSETISIFISPPSMEELEKRLRARKTDSEETILLRLKNAEKEMEYSDKYQYNVINDNLESAVKKVTEIIKRGVD